MYDETSPRDWKYCYVLFHEIRWLYIINITNKFTYNLTSPRSTAILKLRLFTSQLMAFLPTFLPGGPSVYGPAHATTFQLLMPVAGDLPSLPAAFSHAPVCLLFESMRFIPY